MTTSAYNLGNSGLASKILRTKDLMRAAGVEGVPVLGIEAGLGELWGIPNSGLLRFLSKGCTSQGWAVEGSGKRLG